MRNEQAFMARRTQVCLEDAEIEEESVSAKEVQVGMIWGVPAAAIAVAGGLYLAFRMGRRASAGTAGRESDEFSRFFALALDLFCIADTQGHFRKLNKAWETTLGYSLEELEGRVFLDFVHPDDLEGTLAAIRTLEEQREVLNFVNRYRCKDGTYRWIEWRSYPVGELIYAAARDITASKQAEEALRNSEQMYRALAEQLGEGLVTSDRDGVYRYCNKRFAEMLGYAPAELLGKGAMDIVMEHEKEATRIRLEERRRGKSDQYEAQLMRKDGSPLDCLLSAAPIFDEQGGFRGSLVLFTDITARKKAEEAARQVQKSESLSLMASGIAHDFNNLFQSIQGNLEIVLANPGDLGKVRGSLERALRIVGEAASLSRKILDYSGRGFRRSVAVDLRGLLLSRLEQLKLFARAEIQFQIHIEENLPDVKGDPDQILQVLTGLIANAGEAMEAGPGEIRLSLERSHLSDDELRRPDWVEPPPSADVVSLTVSDSGKGIAPEHLGRIFDPFFSTKAAGRGLGLSAAIGIIRNHQAGLRVASTPAGSAFRICFALAGLEDTCDLAVRVGISPLEVKTILLVDDDPDLRDVTAESLHDILGYQVLVARDGAEAVEVFREHADTISLILMDAIMPRFPGSKAFEAIKQIRPDAKAILCSGYGDEVGIEAMDRHGFLSFLKKPFSIKELSEAIEKAMREGR